MLTNVSMTFSAWAKIQDLWVIQGNYSRVIQKYLKKFEAKIKIRRKFKNKSFFLLQIFLNISNLLDKFTIKIIN